jgi:hypothetical protein
MTDERRKAIEAVWRALKNPLCMMSRPEREEAMKLAREHELTVSELLEYVYARRRNA